jgi:acyl carrier protein
MIPAAFVTLPSLPRNPSGKVDRRALPAPGLGGAGREQPFVPPRTPTEAAVARIWAELLGVERVGAEDHFFQLGGHSLKAIQLASRLRDALGVEVPLRTLFTAPRLCDLASAVDGAPERSPAPPVRIVPQPRGRHSREQILVEVERLSGARKRPAPSSARPDLRSKT